jgi:hypothetical protein
MNTDVSRSAPPSTALPDRAALRAQLEETQSAFHGLMESLTNDEWHSKTATTAWTICEVMTHLADGLARLPEAIAYVRQGKHYFNLPSWLRHPINRWLVKWSARGQTRESILARYDQAHSALLATLEGIRDDEWSRGAQCYGLGYTTVLDLCVLPHSHSQEHTAQVAPRK